MPLLLHQCYPAVCHIPLKIIPCLTFPAQDSCLQQLVAPVLLLCRTFPALSLPSLTTSLPWICTKSCGGKQYNHWLEQPVMHWEYAADAVWICILCSPYPSLPSIGPLPSTKLSYDSPRYKLTPERAIPLIKWFEEHKEHPYPTRHEKIILCQSTQLTFTQVY